MTGAELAMLAIIPSLAAVALRSVRTLFFVAGWISTWWPMLELPPISKSFLATALIFTGLVALRAQTDVDDRARFTSLRHLVLLFGSFTAWLTLTLSWSSNRLAGMAELSSIVLTALAATCLVMCSNRPLLAVRVSWALASGAAVAAVVQTLFDAVERSEGLETDLPEAFLHSALGPQTLSAGWCITTLVVISSQELRVQQKVIRCAALGVLIFLTGSRTFTAIYLLVVLMHIARRTTGVLVAASFILTSTLLVPELGRVISWEHRALGAFRIFTGDLNTGTLDFRQLMRDRVWDGWAVADASGQWFGQGAGHATTELVRLFGRADLVTYNSGRVVHNDFVLTLAEAGIVGVVLFSGFIACTILHQLRRGYYAWCALIVAVPMVLLENVIASGFNLMGFMIGSLISFPVLREETSQLSTPARSDFASEAPT